MSMKTFERPGSSNQETTTNRQETKSTRKLRRFEREIKKAPNPTNISTVMIWDTKTMNYKLTPKPAGPPMKDLIENYSKTLENVKKELKARTKHFFMPKDSSNYELIGISFGLVLYVSLLYFCLEYTNSLVVLANVGIFGLGIPSLGFLFGWWHWGKKLKDRTSSLRSVLGKINSGEIDVTGGAQPTQNELRFSLGNSEHGAYFLVERAADLNTAVRPFEIGYTYDHGKKVSSGPVNYNDIEFY